MFTILKAIGSLLLDREFNVELACSRSRRTTTALSMLALAFALSFPSLRQGASAADATAPAAPAAITLRGRVLSQGMPVAGAKVFLRESPISWSRSDAGWRPTATQDIAEMVADADGSFEFKDVKPPDPKRPRERVFPLDVFALAPEHGVCWLHLSAQPTAAVELSLPDERKLAGQLVDGDGKAVADARVRVREIAALTDAWRPALRTPSYIDLDSCGAAPSALSDADGRFVIRGVPDGARATLVVDDNRVLLRETCVAATDEPQDDLVQWLDNGQSRSIPVRSWYCKIEVERGYRLRGQVVFADTGKPAVGAGFNHPPSSGPSDGVVDAEGRFTLHCLAPGKVRLRITPPAGSGYLGFSSDITLSGDNHDLEQVVKLQLGELVRGKVVDANSGKGLGGAEIFYFGKSPSKRAPDVFVQMSQSDAEGRFAIAVLPGEAMLIVAGSVPGYTTYNRSGSVTAAPIEFHRPINVKAGQPHPEVTFQLQPKLNAAVAGHVVDADGNPVGGAEINYQGSGERGGAREGSRTLRTMSDADGAFKLDDLDPSFEYSVRMVAPRQGQGAFVTLSGLETKRPPLIIKLRPLAAAAGRVVDEQHQPLAAVLWLRAWHEQFGSVDREPVTTDAEGRFELPRLIPDAKYSVEVSAEGYASKTEEPFAATAGENRSLGDMVLLRADKELLGVLVDADGAAVSGALVRASSASDPSSYRVTTKVCVTDREGRFRLRGLPAGGAFVWQVFNSMDYRKTLLGQAAAGSQNLRFVVNKQPDAAPARKRQ